MTLGILLFYPYYVMITSINSPSSVELQPRNDYHIVSLDELEGIPINKKVVQYS